MTAPRARPGLSVPVANTLTPSPLRNRIRLELEAPVSEVWALVGDLKRFPEYSLGLDRVEAEVDSGGACTEYVCHFKPQEEGGVSISHREIMRWYEPRRGFASVAEEGNAFGLTNSLTLVTLESSSDATSLQWDQYYDAHDLDMNRAVFDDALADIGKNLVHRFGGQVLERSIDGR